MVIKPSNTAKIWLEIEQHRPRGLDLVLVTRRLSTTPTADHVHSANAHKLLVTICTFVMDLMLSTERERSLKVCEQRSRMHIQRTRGMCSREL